MIGANLIGENVHFRVWAPEKRSVTLVLENGSGVKTSSYAMKKDKDGFFSDTVPISKAGSLYRYQLDNDGNLYPDPVSCFQPKGPFGPSQIIDHGSFHGLIRTGRAFLRMSMSFMSFTSELLPKEVPGLPQLKNYGN